MKDFWRSSGYHLLDRHGSGGLVLTNHFLKAYFARPEIMPPADACDVERRLHAALLSDPRLAVDHGTIAMIRDTDARTNWSALIGFRDYLLAHQTLESAYLALMRQGVGSTPPLFIAQLVHVILRNALDGCEDAHMVRAGELFFRHQHMITHQGALLAVDDETVVNQQSPLAAMMGLPPTIEIDVLGADNAGNYWSRSDKFDMALDLTTGRRALAALAAVIEHWVAHLLAVEVEIEPLSAIDDDNFMWYVGLDAQATRIGDCLWRGDSLDDEARNSIVGLYRLAFRDASVVLDNISGPTYLLLAMEPDETLRMKPQNLLTGLPIRHLQACS